VRKLRLARTDRIFMNIPTWLKPALYGAVAGGIVVSIIGFSWGGWVTGGSAQQAATDAADASRSDLASAICVQNFMASDDARTQLAALQEITSNIQQRRYIIDGGWAVMPDAETPSNETATLCARMLSAIEPIELPVVDDGEVVEPGVVADETDVDAAPAMAPEADADAAPAADAAPDAAVEDEPAADAEPEADAPVSP
jgi:hypothetical protein